MSRYLLDTSVLIDFSKNREPARSFIFQAIESGDELAVCPLPVAEFYAGVDPESRPVWDQFFADLMFWPLSPAASRQAGVWRYQFDRQGTPLAIADLLIAAVAVEQHAVLVTTNVKDFPMPEILLLNLQT